MRTFDKIIADIRHELTALDYKAKNLHSGYVQSCQINLSRFIEELVKERKKNVRG